MLRSQERQGRTQVCVRDLYCTDRLAESSSLACVTAVSLLPRVCRAYVQRLVGFELSHHPEFTIAMTLGSKLLLREVQCRRGIALLSMRPRVRDTLLHPRA